MASSPAGPRHFRVLNGLTNIVDRADEHEGDVNSCLLCRCSGMTGGSPAGPRTEAGRLMWHWPVGDLGRESFRERILAIEREAASLAAPEVGADAMPPNPFTDDPALHGAWNLGYSAGAVAAPPDRGWRHPLYDCSGKGHGPDVSEVVWCHDCTERCPEWRGQWRNPPDEH